MGAKLVSDELEIPRVGPVGAFAANPSRFYETTPFPFQMRPRVQIAGS